MGEHEKDIIDEIHERRAELLAQFDYDLGRFAEYLREREKEHPKRLVDQVKVVHSESQC